MIKIMPPKISAKDFNSLPNFFPIKTPINDVTRVIKQIIVADTTAMDAEKFEMAKPTESASIEVAIACNNIAPIESSLFAL